MSDTDDTKRMQALGASITYARAAEAQARRGELARCHLEVLVAAPASPRGSLWVGVDGEFPIHEDPRVALRAFENIILAACGQRPRIRWRPSGLPDGEIDVLNEEDAPIVLGAHPEAGDVFHLIIHRAAGTPPVYAIADPRWLENATAVWRVTGASTWPPVAFVAHPPPAGVLDVATKPREATGAPYIPGTLVAWCRIPRGGDYPAPEVQRLALEHHLLANGG